MAVPDRARLAAQPLAIIGVGLGLLALAGTIALLSVWDRSLGPELVSLEPGAHQVTPEPAVAPTGDPQCGGPPVMTVMIIGSDTRAGDYTSGAADVIRVIRVNFVSPSAVMLAVPRDLWVTIPGLESYGIEVNRIKMAFAYGNRYPETGGGPSLLAQTLLLNFGMTVDRYAVVNFEAFEAGIDVLGGIDVFVPETVGGDADGLGKFAAGWQHLDGEAALRYARMRPDNTSDMYRIDRQTQVIAAIRDRVFSPDVLPALPGLVASMQGSTLTDLSPAQVSALICIGKVISPEAIYTVTIEGDNVVMVIDEFGYERLLPDVAAVRGLVRAFQSDDPSVLNRP